MTIEPEIIGVKKHKMLAQYIEAACPNSLKLICCFVPMKHYVVLGELLRLYFGHGMRLMKVHREIRFTSSPDVAGYIANNTTKQKQFKHDNVKKALYKLMTNSPYWKSIENVARRTDIRLLHDMDKARKLAKKPHCVDYRVLDCLLAPLNEQVENSAAEEQRQQNALMGIKIQKLNYLINKPFANSFCVLEYSKLKLFVIVITFNDIWPSIIYTVLQFPELVRKAV